MSVRTDVTVNFNLSPRIITVAAPSTEITQQDLLDTLRDIEDSLPAGMSYAKLIDASGKEDLGGGTLVGITTQLQNAQVYFAARTTALDTGTVTTTGVKTTDTITLTDSAATFITDGIGRGDVVFNRTDLSFATVVSVESETQLTSLLLTGGTDNNFDTSDVYSIYDEVQCEITGGNMVAVDSAGNTISPILESFGTQLVRTASSSATLQEQQEIENTQYLIESLRPHHTGQGDIYYWDPIGGNDSNSGLAPSKAAKSGQHIVDNLVTAGNHDIIVALSVGSSGQVEVDETLTINKNYTFLRGPGRDFRIKPTSTTAPTISIDAVGVEVSGMVVDTAATGGQSAIEVQDGADFFFVDHIWSRDAQHTAVDVLGSTVYGRIDGCFFSHTADSGIHIDGDVRHTRITNTELDACGANGITIEGTTARNNIIGQGVKIYDSSEYGIRINSPATRNFIDSDVSLYDNASGDLLDNGTTTENEKAPPMQFNLGGPIITL